MHNRLLLFILFTIFLVTFIGCQSMTYMTKPESGIYSGKLKNKEIRSFEVSNTAHYLFWGLAPISRPCIEEMVKGQAADNQVVGDIKIYEQNSFLNGFLAAITYGLYRPRTIRLTGHIYEKGEL